MIHLSLLEVITVVSGFELFRNRNTKSIKKISRLNIVAPYSLRITLNDPIVFEDLLTTAFEFVSGSTGVVYYNLDFNNNDSTNFQPNENVVFDGNLRLRTDFNVSFTKDVNWNDVGELNRLSISRSQYPSINRINVI